MRNYPYGRFRTEVPADKGYSHEIVHPKLDPKWYDNVEQLPLVDDSEDTLLKMFKKRVAETPDKEFLGTRIEEGKDADGKMQYGAYKWRTWAQVDKSA